MGHDPRKAGPAPASVPAGSMRMPPTAAETQLPPWGGSDVATRLAWLEQQVRSLAAAVFTGPPSSSNLGLRVAALEARQREAAAHDCWAAAFPPDQEEPAGATLRGNLATLAEAWGQRLALLGNRTTETMLSVPKATLTGRRDELERCRQALLDVLGWEAPASPPPVSPPVRKLVDDAVAAQAEQVAARVTDLIEHWERLARNADEASAACSSPDKQVARFEHAAEAAVYRYCAQQLRTGGVA